MLVNGGYKVHTCPKSSQRTSANRLHEKRKSASRSSYPVEFPFSEHKERRYSMVSFWDLTDKISPAESVAVTSGKSFLPKSAATCVCSWFCLLTSASLKLSSCLFGSAWLKLNAFSIFPERKATHYFSENIDGFRINVKRKNLK